LATSEALNEEIVLLEIASFRPQGLGQRLPVSEVAPVSGQRPPETEGSAPFCSTGC